MANVALYANHEAARMFNPAYSFLKTHLNLMTGRLHFPRNRIGNTQTMEDGREFTVFMEVSVDSRHNCPVPPQAVFRVRFQLANMTPQRNKVFALLPIPFIVGLPGFRSKLWMLEEKTGTFQGIYEWDTVDAAQIYANSFAMKFMTRRSIPGSVSYRIFPREEWNRMQISSE